VVEQAPYTRRVAGSIPVPPTDSTEPIPTNRVRSNFTALSHPVCNAGGDSRQPSLQSPYIRTDRPEGARP
jgi:hypothetical protein